MMNQYKLRLYGLQADQTLLTADDISIPPCPSPLTTGTTASSNNTLPSTPGCDVSGQSYFSIQELDDAIKRKIGCSDTEQSLAPGFSEIDGNVGDPYAKWKCGFGYTGHLSQPVAIPAKKANFIQAVQREIHNIHAIQDGFVSYIEALNSGVHHDFDQDFLHSEGGAADITVTQLHTVKANLQAILKQVDMATDGIDQDEVRAVYQAALGHAQPWVIRARAILVSAHVFYKINYVLGGGKKAAN